MKKQLLLLPFIASSCLAAASNPVGMPLNVCVYDPDVIASKSDEYKSMVTEVDNRFKSKFDGIEKEKESLRTDVNKFQAKMSMMNDSSREAEQEVLMRRERDLKTNAEHVMQDYKGEREKLNMRFFKKLDEGMNSFKTAYKIDIAMPKNPLVFASNRADQTNAIVTHLNKLYEDEKKTMVASAKKPTASATKTA